MFINNSLYESIDSYCERIDISLLGEPLNLISNGGFFIAAWLLHSTARAQQTKDATKSRSTMSLVAMIYAIGLGSALFHSFANRITMMMDVAPIGLYIIFYLWHWSTNLMGFSLKRATMIMTLWLATTAVLSISLVNFPLGGSQSYLSVAIFLFGMGWFQSKKLGQSDLLLASLIFAASLTFRSIDPYICPVWTVGTHFLWHLANSVVLFLTGVNSLKLERCKR